jgi:serpin B
MNNEARIFEMNKFSMKAPQRTIVAMMSMMLFVACEKDPVNPHIPAFNYTEKSARVIRTNNDFGLELFDRILEKEDKPNVMISPASVSMALGMTCNGAETTTREAFEEVLNYEGLSRQEINEIFRELIHVLVTNGNGNQVEIANSLWNDEGFPILEDFIALNTTYYDAEVRELDLQAPGSLEQINNWVSNKTHHKIPTILNRIDPEDIMVLINALYFNCVWETEFEKDQTEKRTFYTESGEAFGEVDMMRTESAFRTHMREAFTGLELPYKNGKYSMFLFLPSRGRSVSGLVQELDGSSWEEWMDGFGEASDVEVLLPRFRFDYHRSLGDDLKAMGLEIAFMDGLADFSSMSPLKPFMSRVEHKTFVDVNEKGTEAAAVTAVVMSFESAGPMPLVFDRPFLFAITENSSRSIVFIGKVEEPSYTP